MPSSSSSSTTTPTEIVLSETVQEESKDSKKERVYCGDGVCGPGENKNKCPSDCQEPKGQEKTKETKAGKDGITGGVIGALNLGKSTALLTTALLILVLLYLVTKLKAKKH